MQEVDQEKCKSRRIAHAREDVWAGHMAGGQYSGAHESANGVSGEGQGTSGKETGVTFPLVWGKKIVRSFLLVLSIVIMSKH